MNKLIHKYTTGSLLDCEYSLKRYRLIAINKQIELENLDLKQQIDFIGWLERNEGASMFFIIEKRGETTFDFSQYSVIAV